MPALPAADSPFERAVTYGNCDAGLRDLIHVLKFQRVRPSAAVLGRLLAETVAKLEQTLAGSLSNDILQDSMVEGGARVAWTWWRTGRKYVIAIA